jgi:uncharacterized membrane protein YkvA (DUF1232 family)
MPGEATMAIRQSFEESLKTITEHHYAISQLTRDLKVFESRVATALERNDPIIESSVQKLVETARTFLKLCQANGRAAYVTHCLAAVDYLVNPNDAVEDFATYDGFDDDYAVFEMVIQEFDLGSKFKRSVA